MVANAAVYPLNLIGVYKFSLCALLTLLLIFLFFCFLFSIYLHLILFFRFFAFASQRLVS